MGEEKLFCTTELLIKIFNFNLVAIYLLRYGCCIFEGILSTVPSPWAPNDIFMTGVALVAVVVLAGSSNTDSSQRSSIRPTERFFRVARTVRPPPLENLTT